ncbi:ATP-binding cassette domain-containing protein [uncultured Ezakiella sp.]|uniref:ABC transporter ATP-binding protein n=1 Tax=uncultured Ezakiella sp. TaxID=1637529 RepID=UPI0025F507D5|nr:ATP-binding cassette domain-containing protein [uncultured Ezakiella sp.]
MDIINTKNLTMKFKEFYAIKDVSIDVKSNQIYGLVGKNGAGKTTLMKCLLGLLPGSSGKIKMFETDNLAEGRRRTGALIEEPGFFKNLTGYQNLMYFSKAFGINDSAEVLRLLQLLKLSEAKDKKYKNYSLGMKQRLGIALALIGNPDLLVLDEPINGIDPEGIVEMRNLFKSLVYDQGKTIIISSHILSEVENLCDNIAIIEKGQVIDVIENHSTKNQITKYVTSLSTDNNDKAKEILTKENISFKEDKGLIIEGDIKTSRLLKLMTENEIEIIEFARKKESLEEYYLERLEEK